jgi:microsomal dipeptidase-like Zn-dependent dipeptidase
MILPEVPEGHEHSPPAATINVPGNPKPLVIHQHNSSGFQTGFQHWPFYNTLFHQQMYIDWIERARQGGLRLMIADVVNNRLLSYLMGREESDLMAFNREVAAIKQLVASGSWFMEIAGTPAEARRIIGKGKIAVVLGIELDEPETLFPQDLSTPQSKLICFTRGINSLKDPSGTAIASHLTDMLVQAGIRHVIPVHVADNSFGGTALASDEFNGLNFFLHDKFLQVDAVPQSTSNGHPIGADVQFQLTNLGSTGPIKLGPFTLSQGFTPTNYPAKPHVNSVGFTNAGRKWIAALRQAGIIVDVSHLSDKGVNELLWPPATVATFPDGIAPPVISSHTGIRDPLLLENNDLSERQQSEAEVNQIEAQGGIIGIGVANVTKSNCKQSVRSFNISYLKATRGGYPAAIGTDMNGMNGMTVPLSSPANFNPDPQNPQGCHEPRSVCYNDEAKCNAPLVKSKMNGRNFDINTDGWAHYGMLPDFLQQAVNIQPDSGSKRSVPLTPPTLEKLFQSAEYFIRAWEKDCRVAVAMGGGKACR